MWRIKFIRRTKLAPTIWEFRFVRPADYEYLPGQYASFTCRQSLSDTRGQSRTMSLTSHPSDDFLSFVTQVPADASPFKQHLSQLEPGDEMYVDAALGDLILPKSSSTPLVFVAGGIGIASFVSMLRELVPHQPYPDAYRLPSTAPDAPSDLQSSYSYSSDTSGTPDTAANNRIIHPGRIGEALKLTSGNRPVHLLYALHHGDEKLFGSLLDDFNFASARDFVSPNLLSAEIILQTTPDSPDSLYYLSGAERFVEGLRADLRAHGLSDTRIIFDYFTGY